MGLLKQARPTFNTAEELKEYIARKEESLCFWSTLKTVDTSEKVGEIRKDIIEAKELLAEWKNKEEVSI